ncbi:hypothetical protein CGCS363_v009120 [Colletotrichum siamense]|uniref:uncharacterized protein n=1 Tax=Colletotrichum siamense TaxID=690259 RepID=UPI001872DC3B|nr:uncharacterized protein CGCS363_v009120 [Colletotrichum siamense]KAF5495360.1 hypothetical protein CGCS363_v009120 [Colletotrichum siamense]
MDPGGYIQRSTSTSFRTAHRPLLTGPSVLHARPPTFHRVTPLAPKVIDKVHLHEQPIPGRDIDENSSPVMEGPRKKRLVQHQDSTA